MKFKWISFVLLALWGMYLFIPEYKPIVYKDPGVRYVSSYCRPMTNGVMVCTDGVKTWYIYTSNIKNT